MSAVPRSLLFVPGARPDMVAKLPRWAPDAVAVDLEDAVAATEKAAARASAVSAVGALDGGTTMLIRVNGARTEWFADDVAAVADSAAGGVVLPKLEHPGQLDDLHARLDTRGRGDLVVVAGLESARGVATCRTLLGDGGSSPVLAVYFGAEDYIASVGGRRTATGHEVLMARSEVVLAAALAGVGCLDQAVVAAHDPEAFRADAVVGRDLGYHGKICIHPSQVGLAHEVFTPSDEEVAHARAVLEAGRSGVGVVDGTMVDDVHVRMAESVLLRKRL